MTRIRTRGNGALFYHRDSSGRHDQTPGKYVELAQGEIRALNLQFDGTAAGINSMIQTGQPELGDLYVDYDVKGNLLERPALNALMKRVLNDSSVSHLFIPLRERLARPHDPEDGMKLEKAFRRAGMTIHFQDCVLKPLAIGERADVGELMRALIDYEQAGKFRRDLARKMIEAQRNLGEQGLSTGGRPPFFLRRWLVDPCGKQVRELAEREVVRMPGHHVAWLPSSPDSLELALRIVELLETLPASRVAARLTSEGIPSPDAGRSRTDRGTTHRVTGAWHATTIANTVRSLYLIGKSVYGRRSMGDEKRYSPSGPRDLTEDDFREDGKPKVIANDKNEWTIAPARYAPLVNPERIAQLIAKLDDRGKTQRGKPRSPDPANNPLGCRVFDMSCGWPMYREPYAKKGGATFRYKCGAYSQSHGAVCTHNHVDGPAAAQFVLSAIRQRLVSPALRRLVEEKLANLAKSASDVEAPRNVLAATKKELSQVREDLEVVQRNLARAKSDDHHRAIAAEFDALKEQEIRLLAQVEKQTAEASHSTSPQQEVAVALGLLDKLTGLASSTENFSAARELFDSVDAKLFLRFRLAKWGNRDVYKVSGGVLTFGATTPPVQIYEGRTGRIAVQGAANTEHAATCVDGEIDADERGDSLGNVSRGDRS